MVKPLKKVCCLELRTAGYIIGWLGVFGGVLCLLIGLVGLGNPKIYSELIGTFTERKDAAVMFPVIFIVSAFVDFAIFGLVIYGIKENRLAMLIPYLIFTGISAGFSFLGVMFAVLGLVSGTHDISYFLYLVFSCMFQNFIFYVMYSLYKFIEMNILNGRV